MFRQGVVRVQTGELEVRQQCHPNDEAAGIFGTQGLSADNSQAGERNFKIPHFRDQYQKVGMFGWGFNTAPATGAQVRGFSLLDRAGLEALINGPGQTLTFTCTPWGSGQRIGIDRDSDGILDGDE